MFLFIFLTIFSNISWNLCFVEEIQICYLRFGKMAQSPEVKSRTVKSFQRAVPNVPDSCLIEDSISLPEEYTPDSVSVNHNLLPKFKLIEGHFKYIRVDRFERFRVEINFAKQYFEFCVIACCMKAKASLASEKIFMMSEIFRGKLPLIRSFVWRSLKGIKLFWSQFSKELEISRAL